LVTNDFAIISTDKLVFFEPLAREQAHASTDYRLPNPESGFDIVEHVCVLTDLQFRVLLGQPRGDLAEARTIVGVTFEVVFRTRALVLSHFPGETASVAAAVTAEAVFPGEPAAAVGAVASAYFGAAALDVIFSTAVAFFSALLVKMPAGDKIFFSVVPAEVNVVLIAFVPIFILEPTGFILLQVINVIGIP
jgi:hypothetical protein